MSRVPWGPAHWSLGSYKSLHVCFPPHTQAGLLFFIVYSPLLPFKWVLTSLLSGQDKSGRGQRKITSAPEGDKMYTLPLSPPRDLGWVLLGASGMGWAVLARKGVTDTEKWMCGGHLGPWNTWHNHSPNIRQGPTLGNPLLGPSGWSSACHVVLIFQDCAVDQEARDKLHVEGVPKPDSGHLSSRSDSSIKGFQPFQHVPSHSA